MARFVQQASRHSPEATQVHIQRELSDSLLAAHPSVSPKYLYDALGSRLFDAITELAEYYPTRTEAGIFAKHQAAFALRFGTGRVMLDLGAGNCAKAEGLFAALQPKQYVPIDISVDFLRSHVQALAQRHPGIDMLGVGTDFSQRLQLPAEIDTGARLLFYPGSSIGNFAPEEAAAFLRRCAESTGKGTGLLIGVDLVKAINLLEPAYDDALGVTAAFNKNMLLNINQLLGSNFSPRQWRHVALFDTALSRIEMHLEAKQATHVRWQGGQRTFTKGQRIHTENSYKYTVASFTELLHSAGFGDVQVFTDEAGWFGVFAADFLG